MVRTNDIDVLERLVRILLLSGYAEIRHGLPDEQRSRQAFVQRFSAREDALDEINAAQRGADQVVGLGSEEYGR